MPLGVPVVPEENSTHSGASKGSSSNDGSAGPAVARLQETARSSSGSGSPRLGTDTVTRTVGRALRSSSTSARRSCSLPFQR